MKGRLRLREVMVIIMIKEIIHDPLFLSLASRPATPDDMNIAVDLIETLHFHQNSCVGMAANMIGERVRIIAFAGDEKLSRRYFVMFNPEIIKKEGAYDAEESCLALTGEPRPCKRYKTIKVKYQDENFAVKYKTYTGSTAETIQHEIDHCDGVLI